MARTIQEIKNEMTLEFMSDENIRTKYALQGYDFEAEFSKASVESILFYVFAFCAWTIEKLFDTHKEEVAQYISEMKPHSLRWYVNIVKNFRLGQQLIEGTDQYDDSGLTDEQIEALKIVKYASAEEIDGRLYVKVAKDNNGVRTQLSSVEESALASYISQVKDAGVRVSLRNAPAVNFKIDISIYYDPTILKSDGRTINGDIPVVDAIKSYLDNLPFNGEYRNVDLVDILQQVEGIIIPELHASYSRITNAEVYEQIIALERPFSGYYSLDEVESLIEYIPYASNL